MIFKMISTKANHFHALIKGIPQSIEWKIEGFKKGKIDYQDY